MKTLKSKLNSTLVAFIVMSAIGFIVTSCNKDEAIDSANEQEIAISEEEFMRNLNEDPIAINYNSTLEAIENVITEVVQKNNLTPDEFRTICENEKSSGILENLLVDTDIIAVVEAHQQAKLLFEIKYSNLQNDLMKFSNISTPVQSVNAQLFGFLDYGLARGCRKYSKEWWLLRACMGTCGVTGASCAFAVPVCAAIVAACLTACSAAYC